MAKLAPQDRLFSDIMIRNLLVVFLILCLQGFLILTAVKYMGNYPVLDDYYILRSLNELQNSDSSFAVFYEPHNRHRIAFTRLIFFLDSHLGGGLNFERIALFSALSLSVIAFILTQPLTALKAEPSKAMSSKFLTPHNMIALFCGFIVAAIVMKPSHWKMHLYPMADLSALWGYAFGLLFLMLALSETVKFRVLSLLVLCLALSTNSSNLMLLPALGAVFLLDKKWGPAALIFMMSVALYKIYTLDFGSSPGGLMGVLASHPTEFLRFSLGLLGSSLAPIFGQGGYATVCAGVILALLALHIIVFKPTSATPRLRAFLIYSGIIIGLIALGRTKTYLNNWDRMIVDGRYSIYSTGILAICANLYLPLLFQRLQNIRLKAGLALGSLALMAWLYIAAFQSYEHGWRHWNNRMAQTVTQYIEDCDTSLMLRKYWAGHLYTSIENGTYVPPGIAAPKINKFLKSCAPKKRSAKG